MTNPSNNSVTEITDSTDAVTVIKGSMFHFRGTDSCSSDGTFVWITSGTSVTRLWACCGDLASVVTGSYYDFRGADAVASNGTDVWVASTEAQSQEIAASFLTELNSGGGFVRIVSGAPIQRAISFAGSDFWVVSDDTGDLIEEVTEYDASSGNAIKSIPVHEPTSVSSDANNTWIASLYGSVTEVNDSTGEVTEISGSTYGFDDCDGISSDGTDVWVANQDNSVTELSASTGALVRVIKGTRYHFDLPYAISSDGTDVWVVNEEGNSVTELNASTGELVKVIR